MDPMHPVEFAADQQAQLVNWVSARLGRPVVPPDLSKSGYHLMGGRVVATDHGPAGMFLYQNADGHRMTLFVRPMGKIDMNANMQPVQMADTTGFVWANNGLGISLVANHPMANLHDLANQVRSDMGSRI
jgi:anti-sigma factor RsiW